MNQSETKQEIETRFQIVLTLSMFFPTLLLIFLESAGMDKKQLNDTTLSWSILVGLYILDYVLFVATKKSRIPAGVFCWINSILILGISFFIFPLIIIALAHAPNLHTNNLYLYFYKISLEGLILAPILIFILFIIGFFIDLFSGIKIKWNFKKFKKNKLNSI
jgi:hypothetical protein